MAYLDSIPSSTRKRKKKGPVKRLKDEAPIDSTLFDFALSFDDLEGASFEVVDFRKLNYFKPVDVVSPFRCGCDLFVLWDDYRSNCLKQQGLLADGDKASNFKARQKVPKQEGCLCLSDDDLKVAQAL